MYIKSILLVHACVIFTLIHTCIAECTQFRWNSVHCTHVHVSIYIKTQKYQITHTHTHTLTRYSPFGCQPLLCELRAWLATAPPPSLSFWTSGQTTHSLCHVQSWSTATRQWKKEWNQRLMQTCLFATNMQVAALELELRYVERGLLELLHLTWPKCKPHHTCKKWLEPKSNVTQKTMGLSTSEYTLNAWPVGPWVIVCDHRDHQVFIGKIVCTCVCVCEYMCVYLNLFISLLYHWPQSLDDSLSFLCLLTCSLQLLRLFIKLCLFLT